MKKYGWIFLICLMGQLAVSQVDTLLICNPNDDVQLKTLPNRPGYRWSPSTSLDNPTVHNPRATPVVNTLYVAEILGDIIGENLIINPDFSEGNTGFESEYPFTERIVTQGFYGVSESAKELNGIFFTDCPDHTDGEGLMMVVDGSPVEGVKVWCQQVEVKPNTQYAFSTWVASVLGANPAVLQFSINGENLGFPFTAVESVCQWRQFYELWHSESVDSAEICIVNKNTDPDGNDFALDDFLFVEVEETIYDSTMVIIEQVEIETQVLTIPECGQDNGAIELKVSGATGRLSFSEDGMDYSTSSILSNISAGNLSVTVKNETMADSEFNACYSDINVLVSQNRCPVYIPSAIDRTSEFNDRLVISPHSEFLGHFTSLTLYDRWGAQIHRSNDHNQIINGSYGGESKLSSINPGVYVYQLTISYPDGETEVLAGEITVF